MMTLTLVGVTLKTTKKADELVTTGETAGPIDAVKQSAPYGKLTTYLQKPQRIRRCFHKTSRDKFDAKKHT